MQNVKKLAITAFVAIMVNFILFEAMALLNRARELSKPVFETVQVRFITPVEAERKDNDNDLMPLTTLAPELPPPPRPSEITPQPQLLALDYRPLETPAPKTVPKPLREEPSPPPIVPTQPVEETVDEPPVEAVETPAPPTPEVIEAADEPAPPQIFQTNSTHPQTETRDEPMSVGTVDQAPRIQAAPNPVYPSSALRRRLEGSVTVQFQVDRQGQVIEANVIDRRGPSLFEQPALEAIRQWRFTPAEHEGRQVNVWVVQTLNFQLR